jgi:hypothetical protein
MKKKVKGVPLFQRNEDTKPIRNRILIATPTLGHIRMEWAASRWGQVVPCNWSAGFTNIMQHQTFPIGYRVAEAQNIAVESALQQNYEWLFLHEDDVILPPDCYSKLNVYMKEAKYPVVSGLYFLKANPSEPILYRGLGNSCFDKFKIGEKVWVDGVPTGCLLIHTSLLRIMYNESEIYQGATGLMLRKVFETPSKVVRDPEKGTYTAELGTSDLAWCQRVIKTKVLERAGWKDIAKKQYPFLCDTSIFCRHIDWSTGKQYPLGV